MADDLGTVKVEAASVRNSVISLTCSLVALYHMITSVYFVLTWLPKMSDVYSSIKVHVPVLAEWMNLYGLYLWLALGVCVCVSLFRSFRHPEKSSTVTLAVSCLLATLVLSWMSHSAVWSPFIGLFQGIGAEK